MTEKTGFMPEIILKGNSYQRGVQYGKLMGVRLEEFYRWFVRKAPKEVLTGEFCSVLERLEQTTSEHFPQFFDEIKGWSDGSGIPYEMCRIMAFHNEVKPLITPGCSNFIVTDGPDGPFLARNCDLFETERNWQVLRIAYCDDCFSYVTTGYLGIPNGPGVNEAGLAVGGASSPAAGCSDVSGFPNSGIYLIATQRTVDDCCRLADEFGFIGKGANVPVLDSEGGAAIIEFGGGAVEILRPDEKGFMVATDHSVTGKIPVSPTVSREYVESSHSRYNRITEMLENAGAAGRSVELAKQILGDHQGQFSVCEHVPGGFHTIYSWVIQTGCGGKRIDLCRGYPCRNAFECIEADL